MQLSLMADMASSGYFKLEWIKFTRGRKHENLFSTMMFIPSEEVDYKEDFNFLINNFEILNWETNYGTIGEATILNLSECEIRQHMVLSYKVEVGIRIKGVDWKMRDMLRFDKRKGYIEFFSKGHGIVQKEFDFKVKVI